MASPIRTLARGSALLAAAGVLVAAGWWAGRTALVPPSDPLPAPEPVLYEIVEGTVGRSLRFVAVAEWRSVDLARAGTAGTITSVEVDSGAEIDAGDVLFTVDLRPVVVGAGATPMFRDLALRAEGPDVAQLQELLGVLGFFEGEATGVFDRRTRAAVRAWQEAIGVPVDGVVRRGDVVFVPELPVRVVLAEGIVVGAPVSPGEVVVRRVVGDPEFVIPLVPDQRGLVPVDASVEVAYDGGVWEGRIVRSVENPEADELLLVLGADEGGPLCGRRCAEVVPLLGRSRYAAEVTIVPETTGPVVPIAAITTDPSGATSVTLADGTEAPVGIVAAAGGLAVVDGVSVGTVVVLPVSEPGP